MNRKMWFNEEKVAIALEILRGDEPASVISCPTARNSTMLFFLSNIA